MASETRAEKRSRTSGERRRAMTAAERVPPAGIWRAVGEARWVDAWLNPRVALVELPRGWFAVVGHDRQAHVELGPFESTTKARREWNGIRGQLEAFRQTRLGSGSGSGDRGPGWVAQARHVDGCSECRRLVERRERAGTAGRALPPAPIPGPRFLLRRAGLAAPRPPG